MPGKQLKRSNLKALFGLVRMQPRVSQAMLAQAMLAQASGLQASTVSNLVRELKEFGILVPDGKGDTGPEGGRRSDLLSLDSGKAVFGVHLLRPKDIMSCAVDLQGRILERSTRTLGPEPAATIVGLVQDSVQSMVRSHDTYAGTVVAPMAPLDNRGALLSSATFPWGMNDFRKSLDAALSASGRPVQCVPAGHCAAWYCWLHTGRRYQSFAAYNITREPYSLVSGIVSDGSLFRGPQGTAGLVWGAGDHPPYPFNGSPHSVEQSLRKIAESVLAGSMFIGADGIAITGDFLQLGISIVEPFAELLRLKAGACKVELLREADSITIGGAYLAADVWFSQMLDSFSGEPLAGFSTP